MIRKIEEKIPDKQLQKDFEKYRQRSVELGAADAKVITTDEVIMLTNGYWRNVHTLGALVMEPMLIVLPTQ
jgi:hypothetical protein